MDYRENAGYIITDSCHVGDSEFVLGVHLTAPPAIRYLEMHRPEGLLLGPLFQRPVFRAKGFGGAGAGRSTVPGRTAA